MSFFMPILKIDRKVYSLKINKNKENFIEKKGKYRYGCYFFYYANFNDNNIC